MDVKQKILELLKKSQELADTDIQEDMWQVKNHKEILVPYYQNLLKVLDDRLILLLSNCSLDGEPLQVYRVIDGARHPVRDHLILKTIGLV